MTIKHTAERCGLTADTLRYYERAGLLPPVSRTPGGIRNYTEDDCNWIEFIRRMRSAGLPVEALARYVKLFQEGEHTSQQRRQLLTQERDRLAARIAGMQETLDRLNQKIAHYDTLVAPMETGLKSAG